MRPVRVHGGLSPLRDGLIDFSASINPLGPPESVVRGLKEGLHRLIATYPDPSCRELRRALSYYAGVAEENILPGNGSTQLIYLVIRALRPKRALIVEPSFSEYRNAMILSEAMVDSFLLREERGFSLLNGDGRRKPLEELIECLSTDYGVLFLANPSSPRGELLPLEVIREVARVTERYGVWLVIDEAFIDFCRGASFAKEAVTLERVIILRSMTKFFSLPGLRLGYIIASRRIVDSLHPFLEPWSVNGPAQVAGVLALKEEGFAERSISWLEGERAYLFQALKGIGGIRPFPSHANFLLIRIERGGINSPELQSRLLSRGIYIRDCSSFEGINDRFFRIAVLKREENERLIDAIRDLFLELG